MDTDDLKIKGYLEELYRQTGGDNGVQVSMYDLGAAIGFEKSEAGSLAEQLMVAGHVELKTLSGGISITSEGLAALGISTASAHSAEGGYTLSDGPIADDSDRQTVHVLTEVIKKELPGQDLDFDLLEEIVLDLKTIEVHMLSQRPKTAVLREIFRSLHNVFETANVGRTAPLLKSILD
ncbi:MAG: hypothetical protein WBB19_16620 [Desulforhopalus sp.]